MPVTARWEFETIYPYDQMVEIRAYTRRDFFEKIPDLANKRFIDLGCGSQYPHTQSYFFWQIKQIGSLPNGSKLLHEWNFNKGTDKNAIAVDIDYRHCAYTFKNSSFVGADTTKLPFRSEIADIVALGWLFDYWFLHLSEEGNGAQQTIEEAARVLRPDGHLVGDVALHPIRSKFEDDRAFTLSADLPDYVLQAERYRELIEQGGFKLLEHGLGFNSDQLDEFIAFYFLAQKK